MGLIGAARNYSNVSEEPGEIVIADSFFKGTLSIGVSGSTAIGGILGFNWLTTWIKNSYVLADLSANSTSSTIGGVLGLNSGHAHIASSYFIGKFAAPLEYRGNVAIGGVVGYTGLLSSYTCHN